MVVMSAESQPDEKDTMVKQFMNFMAVFAFHADACPVRLAEPM